MNSRCFPSGDQIGSLGSRKTRPHALWLTAAGRNHPHSGATWRRLELRPPIQPNRPLWSRPGKPGSQSVPRQQPDLTSKGRDLVDPGTPSRFDWNTIRLPSGEKSGVPVIRAIGRQADRRPSGSLFDVEIQPAIHGPHRMSRPRAYHQTTALAMHASPASAVSPRELPVGRRCSRRAVDATTPRPRRPRRTRQRPPATTTGSRSAFAASLRAMAGPPAASVFLHLLQVDLQIACVLIPPVAVLCAGSG